VQPLVDCYTKLRETGRVVLMSLTETWLRSYQVSLCAVGDLSISERAKVVPSISDIDLDS